jgi:hypothetical protein
MEAGPGGRSVDSLAWATDTRRSLRLVVDQIRRIGALRGYVVDGAAEVTREGFFVGGARARPLNATCLRSLSCCARVSWDHRVPR